MAERQARVGRWRRVGWYAVGVFVVSLFATTQGFAQGSSANTGPLTVTGSVDIPSVFVFRGIVQERDPGLTVSPAVDVRVALGSALSMHLGTWHSLQTGSSGSQGPTRRAHYREDVYASIGLTRGAWNVGATFAAFTSPNLVFTTINDLSFKVARAGRYAPYALVALELRGAADDLDHGMGSYLELGADPRYQLGSTASVTFPVRLGLSLNNYYEGFGGDETFGFVSVGGLVTYPLGSGGRFGRWHLRGGADVYRFGATTESLNTDATGEPRASKIVGRVGIAVIY